jgi:alginate O-acetyltransferase complex protein AlgJ
MKELFLVGCLIWGALVQSVEVSDIAKIALTKVESESITLKGSDDWLYSRNELEHLAKGALGQGRVVEISRATKKENADPIPAIVNFNDELKKLGIQLIVVPVPPKMAIYPIDGMKEGDAARYLQEFYAELRAKGVNVLDLSNDFLAAKTHGVYCKQDAHWSPTGIAVAAEKIAALILLRGTSEFSVATKKISMVGDLKLSLDKSAKPSEEVTLREVSGEVFDEGSPILLMGDSHTLIFSAGGDMLAENAGLGEQLAVELQMPIDRIGVKGSAATAVRINLYRKASREPEWLKNKKFVIWCFSCREFTESTSGWVKVPVLKK